MKSAALATFHFLRHRFQRADFFEHRGGELAPKWLTMQKTLPVALWAARPLHWFYLAFYPFNWLLNVSARWLVRQMGIELDGQGDRAPSEEELRLVLAATPRRGVADATSF